MTKSDPWHNSYTCPNCEEDVPCALPLAKFVECPECKTKLEIMVDAEFDNGSWHDLTKLSIAEDSCPECRSDREHKQRMIDFAKKKYPDSNWELP